MTFYKKNDINQVLKNHGYGSIESDRRGPGMAYVPYRTYDNKIIKGIRLFRTSPVTFSDAGRMIGIEKVEKLLKDLKEIGTFKKLSEFGFAGIVPASEKQAFLVKGNLDNRNGIVYDQTFYFLSIEVVSISIKEYNIDNERCYFDVQSEKYEISESYLDSILQR